MVVNLQGSDVKTAFQNVTHKTYILFFMENVNHFMITLIKRSQEKVLIKVLNILKKGNQKRIETFKNKRNIVRFSYKKHER